MARDKGKAPALDDTIDSAKLRDIISYEMSPLFTGAERYNPDDLVARKGLRIYKAMMVDEQVKAVMQFKRDAITSRGYGFRFDDSSELSEEERATRLRVFEKIVTQMRGSFEDSLNAIARGRAYGFSMTEIVYDNVKINGKTYVGINSLLPRDVSLFTFYTDEWGVLDHVEQRVGTGGREVDINKFVHYVHAPEEDVYYGQSDLRQAYRSWYIKDQVIKFYATFLERFAGGFAVIEVEQGSGITANSKAHEALKDVLLNMRQMSGVILPAGAKLDMKHPANSAEFREAINLFDLGIAKSLLVPNLLGLSAPPGGGSYAQSQTHLEAFFWTLNADTRRLESCLNEQLFRRLGDINWGDGDYPQFYFKPASNEHLKWIIDTWSGLIGAGAVVPTEEDEKFLRALLDMPPRDEDSTPLQQQGAQVDEFGNPIDPNADPNAPDAVGAQDIFGMRKPGASPPAPGKGRVVETFGLDAEALKFHTPGGIEHDQSSHGNRYGKGGRPWEDERLSEAQDKQWFSYAPKDDMPTGGVVPWKQPVDDDGRKLAARLSFSMAGMQINQYLRYMEARGQDPVEYSEGFARHPDYEWIALGKAVESLDAQIEESSIPEDAIMFRAVMVPRDRERVPFEDEGAYSLLMAGRKFAEAEPGTILSNPGYSSWAVDIRDAKFFVDRWTSPETGHPGAFESKPVFLVHEAKAGDKGLMPLRADIHDETGVSEIVMKRNVALKVIERVDTENATYLRVKPVTKRSRKA